MCATLRDICLIAVSGYALAKDLERAAEAVVREAPRHAANHRRPVGTSRVASQREKRGISPDAPSRPLRSLAVSPRDVLDLEQPLGVDGLHQVGMESGSSALLDVRLLAVSAQGDRRQRFTTGSKLAH